MDDKTQDSKKTVVAFVAGLIIGGLLVWLFSGSPEATAPEKTSADKKGSMTAVEEKLDAAQEENTDTKTTEALIDGNLAFTVANQSAGMTVALGEVRYPSVEGWIVVHDDAGGELGWALGAARYNTDIGLRPDHVELLRATEAGKTYHVVYYTEDGDRMFDLKLDTPMSVEGGELLSATFVAQ